MLSALSPKPSQPSPEPLSKRAIRGGIWVFALRIIYRGGLGFVRTVMLARLLVLENFGHELPWSLRLKNLEISGKIIQTLSL